MDDPTQLRQQILALQQRNGELENRLAQQAEMSPSDIVLMRRVHEQLEQRFDQTLAERRLFIELVDHSLANVFVIAPDLRLQAINRTARQTFQRLHGFCPRIGDRIDESLAGLEQPLHCLLPLVTRALAGETLIESVAFDGPPYRRHYELRITPLRSDDNPLLCACLFAYDITERTLEQERLYEAEQALRQAQKMEAVGQLTGGIAHDFNNLLGGIFGALELAKPRLGGPHNDEVSRLFDIIEQNASKAASLVQRLLAFSRRQTLLPRATDIQQLVGDMLALLQSSLRSDIQLIDRTASQLWPTCIDPSQLESALLNLCLNARDAMPHGGTLQIHCENLEMAPAQAQRLGLAAGQYLHLRVEDDGQGMPADVAQRAIEPFYTTKPLGQGTGLGLSMVYGFVRQSGGQMHLDSIPGSGTCVHLYLPRAETLQAHEPQRLSPPPTAQSILLVEDQAAMRLVISELLSEAGYDVHAFASPDRALAALRKGLRPHLLVGGTALSDSPKGQQLIEMNVALTPGCTTLLINGYATQTQAAHDGLPANTEVISNPFELKTLLERVTKILA
ncbi:ATP-binding protein [Pseudomonas wayambapalatensis]|uniref:PAS domain-containing sensor histidine kinase n=1 Tax=Pseudomonas wayambapalatensis TaxID=485895 RepID=UPI003CEFC096